MQTFLPYPSFMESAKCLDNKRLGKQRVEARQILNALIYGGGWRNHPAVLMWKGYEVALSHYMDTCIEEWMRRGFNNTMKLTQAPISAIKVPKWFRVEKFHASHRSNLLRKDYKFYSQYNWLEPANLPYFWPTKEGY